MLPGRRRVNIIKASAPAFRRDVSRLSPGFGRNVTSFDHTYLAACRAVSAAGLHHCAAWAHVDGAQSVLKAWPLE